MAAEAVKAGKRFLFKKENQKTFADVARDRGFALIIVLWTLVLVTLLVLQLAASGRTEAQLAANLRRAATLQAAADGAVQAAVFHLLDRSPAHWPADSRPRDTTVGGVPVSVTIDSEAGKINPNNAPPELLNQLLRQVGADARTAATVAAAITAWRSPLLPAADQAAAYRGAGKAYLPPNAPLQSIDELGLVLGMTPDLLARLAPHLSLYRSGQPDLSVADPMVRAAVAAWSGQQTPRNAAPADDSLVVITATAGRRIRQRAIVQLTPAAKDAAFRILDWND